MEKNTSALQIYQACGIGLSLSDQQGVWEPFFFSAHMFISLSIEAFAATGWRVGWLIAPKYVIQPTLAASTRIVFCTNSPLQEAAASGLEQAKDRKFFEIQCAEYRERRKILCDAFDDLGLKYTLPEGSYFVLLVSVFCTKSLQLSHQQKGYIASAFPRRLPVPREHSRQGP